MSGQRIRWVVADNGAIRKGYPGRSKVPMFVIGRVRTQGGPRWHLETFLPCVDTSHPNSDYINDLMERAETWLDQFERVTGARFTEEGKGEVI